MRSSTSESCCSALSSSWSSARNSSLNLLISTASSLAFELSQKSPARDGTGQRIVALLLKRGRKTSVPGIALLTLCRNNRAGAASGRGTSGLRPRHSASRTTHWLIRYFRWARKNSSIEKANLEHREND